MLPSWLLAPPAASEKASVSAATWPALRVSGVVPSCLSASRDLRTWLAVGRSVRSRSAKVIEPVSVRVPAPPISPSSPATSTALTTGTSLVPLRVTVTSWSTTPPFPSLTVTVNTAVTCSPAARKSTSVSAML